jgi:hypothetical protein
VIYDEGETLDRISIVNFWVVTPCGYQRFGQQGGRNLEQEITNLAERSIFVHSSKDFLTCRKILRHGADGFTSPSKEGMLRILSPPENPSTSTGIKPANIGFNDNHASHYATEVEYVTLLGRKIFLVTFSSVLNVQ